MSTTKLSNLQIIENSGPNNLHDVLLADLDDARQSDISVAFITDAGLGEILPSLRKITSIGKVRIITGLYQGVTEPKALRTLLRAQEETRGNLSVKLSKEPKFHRKMYITENKSAVTAIVGSSNLTKEGLISGGELSVAFTFSKDLKSYLKLNQAFEKDWKYQSVPLSNAQIKRYEKYHRESKEKSKSISIPLQKILGEKTIHKKGKVFIDKSVTFWRVGITGIVEKKTKEIIKRKTNWGKKEYKWFVDGKHKYKINDELLVFDSVDKSAYLAKITDTTEVSTSDGRYFVAFKQLKNTRKKQLKKPLWDRLKSLGIIRNRDDAKSCRKLSQGNRICLKIFFINIKRKNSTSFNNRPKDYDPN